MDAMTAENMKSYFDLLREVYNEFDFENHPESIYIMDETGVPLEPRPPKVFAKCGQKKVRCCTSGQKAQITVIGCGSATGQVLPPFISGCEMKSMVLVTGSAIKGRWNRGSSASGLKTISSIMLHLKAP